MKPKSKASFITQLIITIAIPFVIGLLIITYKPSRPARGVMRKLPGTSAISGANCINSSGQVVGSMTTASGASGISHAVLWSSSGEVTNLGVLPGMDQSDAKSINDAGMIVGSSWDHHKQFTTTDRKTWDITHAFLWTKSHGMKDIGNLGGKSTIPACINNNGQVVGQALTSSGSIRSFLWSVKDGMRDMGLLGSNIDVADGINGAGQVVGIKIYRACGINDAEHFASESHAALWSTKDGMRDLETTRYKDSKAFGVNDAGQVVGSAYFQRFEDPHETEHAFLWTVRTGMKDLGTLGGMKSEATCINNSGQVAGDTEMSNEATHAFLWTKESGMQDLGTLGGSELSSWASSINYSGIIVGASQTDKGVQAFIWTPLKQLHGR